MFSLLQLIIGVYLLYCAAMGKGKIFENDYIKVPRAEYVKKLRVLSAFVFDDEEDEPDNLTGNGKE